METEINFSYIKLTDSNQKLTLSQSFPNIRQKITTLLVLMDVFSFIIAAFGALSARVIFGDTWRLDLLPQVLPVILVSLILFRFVGLYPSLGVGAVEELRKLTISVTVVVFSLTALSFWLRNAEEYSRLTLGLTWMISLLLLPLNRDLLRTIFINFNNWGEPVAVIGHGEQTQWAIEFFNQNKKLGLNPTVVLDFSGQIQHKLQNYQAKFKRSKIEMLGALSGVQTALVIVSETPSQILNEISINRQGGFERLIMIPNLELISSYGVVSFDFGGVLGLEIKHNLLNKRQQLFKRALDLLLVIIGGVIILPILIILSALIKVDSKGRLLYGHPRIGKNKQEFKAWKFRTMVANADQILEKYLDEDLSLRNEWQVAFKLRNDPRVTRIGRFLRRYSLDELPQLINVLKGEMSLVGPRPIVTDEIQFYGNIINSYARVRPGITGLWQVSGRSDTSYNERVRLDDYYIRNWSIWLDIHILLRTIGAVLRRDGAY